MDSEDQSIKRKTYQNKFIFEYLKNILTTKSDELFDSHVKDEESFKSFPSVVIMRYLTMSPDKKVRELIVNNQLFLERLDKISHRHFYRWCLDNVPKQYNSFIKYLK